MRWHIDLTQRGNALASEHAETEDLARRTAQGFIRDLKGKGLPEEAVTRLMADVESAEFDTPDPGTEWTFETQEQIVVTIAALPTGESDEDCWVCAERPELAQI